MLPKKHKKKIIAWAHGATIERYWESLNKWEIDENPLWLDEDKYRIYDPFKKVRKAYNRGAIIECPVYDTIPEEEWEWEEYRKEYDGELDWTASNNWRIKEDIRKSKKPKKNKKPKKEIDDDNPDKWMIVTEQGGHLFGLKKGDVFRNNKYEISNYLKRTATKEEVLNAPNYDGTATEEDFPFEDGDYLILRTADSPTVFQLEASVGSHAWTMKDYPGFVISTVYNYEYATQMEIKGKNKWYIHLLKGDNHNKGDVFKPKFKNGILISNDEEIWYNSEGNAVRIATKEEVINSLNYDGTATHEDFKFEIDDWIYNSFKDVVFQICHDYQLKRLLSNPDINKNYFYATREGVENNKKPNKTFSGKTLIPDTEEEGKEKYYIISPMEHHVRDRCLLCNNAMCYCVCSKNRLKKEDCEPFEWKDREKLRDKWIINIETGAEEKVINLSRYFNPNHWIYIFDEWKSPKWLLNNTTFLNGDPCGKKI